MTRILSFAMILGLISVAVPEGPFHDPELKIVGGENATEGEFPYVVALRRKDTLICGGTVLTKSYVLTAAHCCNQIKKKEDFHIYAGSIYLSKGGSNHSIEQIMVHSSYDPDCKWVYDSCVIKVAPSFNLGSKIKQTTLAPREWVMKTRERVSVAGWGLAAPPRTKLIAPDRLQKGVNFTLLTNQECQTMTGLPLSECHICARPARGWQGTWKGDSGGPLIKDGAQIGIASFGYHPSGNRLPAVYFRVMYIQYWIQHGVGTEADQLKYANKTG